MATHRGCALLALIACGPDPAPADPPGPPLQVALEVPEVGFVDQPVTLEAGGAGAVRWRWSLGDGSDPLLTDSPTVTHTYAAPGSLLVAVEALDADGRGLVATAALPVVHPPLAEPPRHSGPLQRIGETDALVAVLPDHDHLVHLADGAVVARWPTCEGPRFVAADARRVVVSCEDDRLAVFDVQGGALSPGPVWTLPRGARPAGLVLDGEHALVALSGLRQLARVSLTTGLREVWPLDREPRALSASADRIAVAGFRGPGDVGRWWTTNGDPAPIALPIEPDPGPDSDTDARGVPNLLGAVAIRPDGRAVAIGGLKANVARGLVRDGLPLTHESSVRAWLRQLSPDTGEDLGGPRFDDRDHVGALAWDPLGRRLYAAFTGTEHVEVIDPFTHVRLGAFPAVGHGPDGLAPSADGRTLWVLASRSLQLVALDVSDPSLPHVELRRIALADDLPDRLDPAARRGAVLFGRSADPRMTAAGYVSCASCHPDGEHDGLTWDFTDRGEGLRNTTSLRGDLEGPLHWSGNFDEIEDFEHDIRGPQAGRGFMVDADFAATDHPLGPPKAGLSPELADLAAYLHQLTPLRSPQPDPERIAWGELIFHRDDVGCATCHPPPRYTDSAFVDGEPVLHDVGTLVPTSGERLGGPLLGLDTPTLRGVHATAPYLHDGRALTVLDVLTTHNPDDAHGRTAHLDSDELAALEAFVGSLE